MPNHPLPDALMRATFVQAHRLLVLNTPLGAERLLAETLEGVESIDEGGFRLVLTALADDAGIALKSLLGQPVRLDLQTAQSRTERRPFHGHVTEAELVGSNGGFARYRLVVEPWLSFLRWREDSYLFQDMSVFDIVESVFADYSAQGRLMPQWRWEIADRGVYPKRGITTQYRESDLGFVSRLLTEEGLYYWFEHRAGKGAERGGDMGGHTLVIADHPGAFKPNVQERIRFHRADASEAEDSIQQWHASRKLQTNVLSRHSWDYKSVDARPLQRRSPAHGGGPQRSLHRADDPGHYAWENAAQGGRLLENAIEALALRDKGFEGIGTVRTLSPASTFVLTQHPVNDAGSEDERRFTVLGVRHVARNNFDEDLARAVDEALGAPDVAVELLRCGQAGRDTGGIGDIGDIGGIGERGRAMANATEEVPHYLNHFSVVRAALRYRPLTLDGHGRAIHPKPTATGGQTAIVTGAGGVLHTDRDHRLKVQMHWQRGGQSSSRRAHPGGDDNAPAGAQLGAWLRVSSAWAGEDWGQVAIARVGQEVQIEFLHGDIDRPVVTGALYNGEGALDEQYNQKQQGGSKSTGNAPAWFAGREGEHAHNAVYSGLKTQELEASQSGAGGYNQLVFDDTPGQSRLGLATTQAASRLHLGHHRQQNDNQRGADRGHGAELATAAQGAIRAGAGLLVSAHAQDRAQGPFLASREAQSQTTQARELVEALAQSAQAQGARLEGEPVPEELEPAKGLKHVAKVLGTTQSDERGATVTAYSEPQLQISAPKGIGLATPKEAVVVSGATSTLAAQEDIALLAQGQLAIGVAKGICLYTVGAEPTSTEPNAERGIRLHAASGRAKLQSQDGRSALAAERRVTIASVEKDVQLEAPKHLLLTVAGAVVKLEGDSIKVHAPGKVTFRGVHRFVGPQGAETSNQVARSRLDGCPSLLADAGATGVCAI